MPPRHMSDSVRERPLGPVDLSELEGQSDRSTGLFAKASDADEQQTQSCIYEKLTRRPHAECLGPVIGILPPRVASVMYLEEMLFFC